MPSQSSAFGAEKYLLATASVFSANAAARLCFSEGPNTVSDVFQTHAIASPTELGFFPIQPETYKHLLVNLKLVNTYETAVMKVLSLKCCVHNTVALLRAIFVLLHSVQMATGR